MSMEEVSEYFKKTSNFQLLCILLFSISGALVTATSDSKIYGGQRLKSVRTVRYIVAIYNIEIPGITCGAVLFTTRLVVTACNCLSNLKEDHEPEPMPIHWFRFIAGESKPEKMFNTGQVRLADATYFHPKCRRVRKMIVYDISIARMSNEFTKDRHVTTLDIVKDWDMDIFRKSAYERAWMNSSCRMAGWGKTGIKTEASKKLKTIQMYLIGEDQCKRIWTGLDPLSKDHSFFQHHQYCTLNTRLMDDTCRGDSGGPYYCGKYPIGIIQNGFGPCGNLEPTIVNSFSLLIEWWDENDNPVRQELFQSKLSHRSYSNPSKKPFVIMMIISSTVLFEL